jgi:hypothetical protein
MLAGSRREKRCLESEVGPVHDNSESKHFVAEASGSLDVADAQKHATDVDVG